MQVAQPSNDQDLLVRGLTHRMNNILTVFHGYVGLMLDNDKLDAATRAGLCKIKAGARAATDLMDRTHSLVRKPTLQWREISLHQLTEALLPALRGMAGTNAKLELSVPPSLPNVWADTGRLRTALVELARNAFEAVQGLDAKNTVVIEAAELSEEESAELQGEHPGSHWVSLAIVDRGPGVPAHLATKIFQPFFSTKRTNDANGLGLNVAQGLIEQCGGHLRFESKPGLTRFEVLLQIRPS